MSFKRSKGFTLIELFLVTALIGMILLALFSAYNSGIRIWRSVKDIELIKNRKLFMSIEKINKELMGYIRDFEDIAFEGEKDEVSFPRISGTDILRISYSFNKGRREFLKKVIKLNDIFKGKTAEITTKLFDARNIKLHYLFFDEVEKEANWVSSFSEKDDGVPEAIRIDITRNNEEISEYIFIPK